MGGNRDVGINGQEVKTSKKRGRMGEKDEAGRAHRQLSRANEETQRRSIEASESLAGVRDKNTETVGSLEVWVPKVYGKSNARER